MIDVLVEASSPDLYAEIVDLLRDHSQLRLLESAPNAERGESGPQPDVVVVATSEAGGASFDSFNPNVSGWSVVGVPVILLTENPARWIAETIPAGVRAVLPRNATPAEIAATIEAVAAGLYVFHPSDIDSLPMFRPRRAEAPPDLAEPLLEALTPREIEVLQLLSGGFGNKEIASRLNISEHTAKFHVASIMAKLGAASRTEAVTLGIRHGLVLI
jgi:DNA-binding NarL/FixJ family response regulator